jgi:hypothetical protein
MVVCLAMCFSASVSFGATTVLVPTGLYALQQARRLQAPYWVMGLTPVFFGIQQGFEGRVWQMLDMQTPEAAVPYALGFLFFSHFLWLWWIPLASYVVEPGAVRRRLFLGLGTFGFVAGSLIYITLLSHPDWLAPATRQHSIVYDISTPYRGAINIGIPPSALYALIILVPLLGSSHRHIRTFGGLVALSVMLASVAWGYAFVSVWCFFAAVISFYLVLMIRKLSTEPENLRG